MSKGTPGLPAQHQLRSPAVNATISRAALAPSLLPESDLVSAHDISPGASIPLQLSACRGTRKPLTPLPNARRTCGAGNSPVCNSPLAISPAGNAHAGHGACSSAGLRPSVYPPAAPRRSLPVNFFRSDLESHTGLTSADNAARHSLESLPRHPRQQMNNNSSRRSATYSLPPAASFLERHSTGRAISSPEELLHRLRSPLTAAIGRTDSANRHDAAQTDCFARVGWSDDRHADLRHTWDHPSGIGRNNDVSRAVWEWCLGLCSPLEGSQDQCNRDVAGPYNRAVEISPECALADALILPSSRARCNH